MKSPLSWLASLFRFFLVPAFFIAVQAAFAQPASELLTNAADVISLSAERASSSIKVAVTGVVTAADPTMKGRFFLQDATGGVFVDNVHGRRPEPGDLVEVSGISHAGAYAPIITAPTVKKIGTAPLPPARPVPIDQLMSGAEDSQRIEVSGIVRAARIDGPRLVVDLASAGYRFRVYLPIPADIDPQTLVAAQVRVRGTAAEAHNRSSRQLISVEVYVPLVSDFVVDKPESVNPFEKPVVPLNSLAQYRRDNSFDQRVHVRGTVTLQRLGENLFLQDAMGGGLQVHSRQMIAFAPGDLVEAVGFPRFENFRPVLGDAVLRKTSEPPVAVTSTAVSIEELRAGLHHADFISIQGKVIDRTARRLRRQGSNPMETQTVLIVQNTNLIFTVEREEPEQAASMAAIPIGSIIEVRGISLTDTDDEGKFKALRVLLPTSNSIRILHKPDWLTPQRLLVGLAVACSLLIVIVSWTVMVSQRNSALKSLIREREKAQIELQNAHDMLEERVKERTEQLKFQITARKESELQSKAVLGERTRLAQELHDTLEQTLTGIALQLDTAAKLFKRSPENAIRHLQLARNLMSQSQVEVRRSVWDLRCRALEQFDLPGALLRSARQFTYGTGIEIEVETKGQLRPLPEVVEENLLRMGQEALTNVIKHSSAHLATIELEFGAEKVVLQIRDDGQGFTPENSAGPQSGHFGLLGMSERAKRLDGQVVLTSAPGKGTTVRVEIPLGRVQELVSPAPTEAQMQS
ncbi:MAG: integral rane sensor signal transduction histidine kinase [Pedosphaera sp.]|nr:integral rane sensor signal transduction histidine kinase [Pedosphaera sp.]